jgi:hypothetical protein
MKMKPPSGPKKQTQFKPKQTQSRNNSRAAKGTLGGLEDLLIGKLVN